MLRNSLIREMSFKANFLLWMIVEVLCFADKLFSSASFFGQVDRIGDWTNGSGAARGTHQMIAQLFQAFLFCERRKIPELSVPENWIRCSFCPLTASLRFH